jgi:hypothetical protein
MKRNPNSTNIVKYMHVIVDGVIEDSCSYGLLYVYGVMLKLARDDFVISSVF